MIILMLALATLQDTTIIIHAESSSVSLEARALPRVVSDEVIRFYNDPGTTRLVGRTKLPRGNEWRGNVAVRNGPVLVAGRIQGTLAVINGDLVFDAGAEVTGDVIVVGGIVDDTTKARIGGEVRQYREPLLYRLRKDGDELVYAPNLRHRLWNPGAQVSWGTADSRSALTIATGGTFNRVEGLPVVFGPLFDWKLRRICRTSAAISATCSAASCARATCGPSVWDCARSTLCRRSKTGDCTTRKSAGARSSLDETTATTT